MSWRLRSGTLTLTLLLLLPTLATAGSGINVGDVGPPVFHPRAPQAGSFAQVSFQFEVHNAPPEYGCRESAATGMYGFPICAYIIQWTLSWDDEWLSKDATPFATGFIPYVWSLHEPGSVTVVDVEEQVYINAPPGEHDVHLRVNWVAGVPISTIGGARPFSRAYPCGLEDYFDAPFMGCSYDGYWEAAPVTSVVVRDTPNPLPLPRIQHLVGDHVEVVPLD